MTQNINELNSVAAGYNLTINHDKKMRRYFINDESTRACLGTYQEWEFAALDAETLEADIENAIDNYEPLEFTVYDNRPRHNPITGHILGGDR